MEIFSPPPDGNLNVRSAAAALNETTIKKRKKKQGAMQLLNRQIAVVNFEPLRAHFLAVHTGTQASLPGLNAMPSLRSCLQRNASEKNPEKVRVTVPVTV